MADYPPPPVIPDDDSQITLRDVLIHIDYYFGRLEHRISERGDDLRNQIREIREMNDRYRARREERQRKRVIFQ